MGRRPTTFLIDPDGSVAHVWQKVKPEGHAAEVHGASWTPGRPPLHDGACRRAWMKLRSWGETSEASARNVDPVELALHADPADRRTTGRIPMTGPADPSARITPGGRSGSWSSSPTPTMRTSGRPARPRAGSMPGRTAGSCAARVAIRVARTRPWIRSSWRRSASGSSERAAAVVGLCRRVLPPSAGRRPGQRSRPARTARSARSARFARTRCWPPTRRSSSTATAGSITRTIGPRGSRPSTRSIPPPATRWPSPGSPRDGLAPHKVRRLYCFWPNQPDVWVDIGSVMRPQDRCPARARQPDPGARGAVRADPRLDGRGGRSRSAPPRRRPCA